MATPLEIVGHNLVVYTSATPETTDDVVRLMAVGIGAVLKDYDGPEFANGLVTAADVRAEVPTRFGLTLAQHTTRLSEAVLDPVTNETVHQGSLAVIAAMALLGKLDVPEGIRPDKLRSAAAIGTVGVEQLLHLGSESACGDRRVRDFASAILNERPADPEALAIELADLPAEVTEFLIEPHSLCEETVYFTENAVGKELFTPSTEMAVADMDLNAETIAKMDWIDAGDFADTEKLLVHTVHANSEPVAYIADLTPFHPHLRVVMKDLAGNGRAYTQFCNKLAFGVINYVAKPGNSRRLRTIFQKLPTYVVGNGCQQNDELIRGYYAPIGTHKDGTPIFGLMAGVRTKDRQSKVLGIISTRRSRDVRL